MKPDKLFRVKGDKVKIQMGEWSGPGETVLCVHGLTSNLTSFAGMAESLRTAHRVLAMDLRGRGGSDKPSQGYSTLQHCRDIRAVAEGLGLERINLMGHSLGAYIALEAAARYPELIKRLVLLDGGADLTPEQASKVSLGIGPSVDRLGQVWPNQEAYLAQMRQSPYYDPWNQCIEEYFLADIEEVEGGVSSRVNADHIALERANLAKVNYAELHPRVACPTLIVRAARSMQGGDDRLLLPSDAMLRMLGAMPQAKVVDLADADHFSLVFQPNPARDAAILEFLAAS